MKEKLKEIYSYKYWRQKIELGEGFKTPGHVDKSIWNFLDLPNELNGKSFLDIGSNDGLFSFEAEKKGASMVVASDLYKESIDSMKNGWSSQGIKLAIEHLNSKVRLHNSGVYHVKEIGAKFDVVFMNDIMNWLEDVELAFKNLGEVTAETLYLSDGFMLDNSSPKQFKIEGGSLRYMYNLSFVSHLLVKNGFAIESIKELNYQKVFLKDYIETPLITIPANTKLFQLPVQDANFELSLDYVGKSNHEMNGFFHINKLGWVNKADVIVKQYSPSLFYRIAKATGTLELYYAYLQSRHKKQTKFTAYIIKAVKN